MTCQLLSRQYFSRCISHTLFDRNKNIHTFIYTTHGVFVNLEREPELKLSMI